MRRFLCAVCTLASVMLLGCSLFNGKEGFLDRAAAKDTHDNLMITKCTKKVHDMYCIPDERAPDCIRYCG